MYVLLIRPPDPLQDVSLLSHTRPMNLAYLAGYLRQHGISVRILDYETTPYSDGDFLARLNDDTPAVVGVSCMTPTIRNGARICSLAKQFSQGIVTVVGGPHANGVPRLTLQEFPCFDYLVYGEGEVTLLELCRRLQDGGSDESIDGLVFRAGDEVVQNPRRALIKDLDTIPFPARDLIEYTRQPGHSVRGFSNKILSTEFFTSRGCPVGCNFCAVQTVFGRTVRFRDPSFIEAEIKELVRDYNFKHFVIADDTFTWKQDRAFALCEIFGRHGVQGWNCDTRVNAVTKPLLRAMKDSGCKKVCYGVESGSQRILDLVGKKITVEQVESAVHWAKEAGIKHIEGNFIIGVEPSETLEDFEKTRQLVLSLPWTFVAISLIVPYPGTQVYDTMRSKDMLDDDIDWNDFVMFGKAPKWHTEHFSSGDLLRMQRELTRTFYLNPKYILRELMSIRSWTEANYWFSAGLSYLRWYLGLGGYASL